MTLACEVAYSKVVEVVTVAYVSDEDRVGNSLFQIWKRGLVIKPIFCSDFEHFGQDFEVEVQASFAAGVWPVFLLMFCRGYEIVSWSRF